VDTKANIELIEKYSARNYHPLPLVIHKAQGVWVWDVDGKKYMDMLASYSALNQGHAHPRIIAALKEQADRVTLTSRAFHNDQFGPFLRDLCAMAGFEKALLMNSGAEAVETAIKLVRKWGYEVKKIPAEQAGIVTCADNFHGRTTTIVGFSTEPLYRNNFGPFTPGFSTIPYGDAGALEQAIGPHTAAFLVEPIQGEAGILIPPAGYLKKARELCTKHNVLLVLDEIQTGFGRTGRDFCFQHEDLRPDVVIVGKALGGGVIPVSGVLADDRLMKVFTPGSHGSTFGGNPLGCAVGRAALGVIREEKLSQRSAELGAWLLERLKGIRSPHVKDVRGLGLFIGVEIRKESGMARKYCERLAAEGILCKETHDQVVRFAPPLVITREELEWALPRIDKVLQTS